MSLLNIGARITSCLFSRVAAGISSRLNNTCHTLPLQNEQTLPLQEEQKQSEAVIDTVNALAKANVSRNFAVIQVLGKQFKITDGDLILLEGTWPPMVGDQIKLDKVLLAGTKDFSLIGRPLVQANLVNVMATVIAKRLSHTKTKFRKRAKKQYMRINFIRKEQTTLRINSIEIDSSLRP